MSYTEIAAAVSQVLGARIEYAPTSIEVFKDKMENLYHFPPFLVQHLVEVAQNYRDGIFAGTNDVVERITGTPPLTVQQFIAQKPSRIRLSAGPDQSESHIQGERRPSSAGG